jgi:EmrB/QacA subfamily drug resistance transporter
MPAERRNPPLEQLHARRWPIFGVTMIGLFMALIDVTIVNISIPQLQRDLHAGVDTVSWVLNAYNIMFAVLLVSMGRLADQLGRRRFFLIGMTIFTLGSLLCALSWSIDALIGFRVLQAVGAGILAPLALATTALVFPPQQRGLGLALIAVVANVAAALGPPLGGLLVEYASWHWIFAINVPIGIAGVILALRVMPETYDLSAGRQVDWWGMTLIGGAVFALTYGLVEANSQGWGSPLIVSLFAAAAGLTAAFVLAERRGRYPMITPALAGNRQFAGASIAFLLFAMGVMGPLFLAVIAFVNLWGYSALEAAFAITPIPVMGMLVSPLVGRQADRIAPRVIGIPALVCMAAGVLWLSSFPAQPDYLEVLPALVLMGIGMGGFFPAVSVGAMGSISGQELGLGSGIVNMARQLGFALGVAVLVAVFTGALEDDIRPARTEAAQEVRSAGLERARGEALVRRAFANPTEDTGGRLEPRSALERRVADIANDAARDSFASGFRVAGFAVLLAIPFALAMRRRPAEAAAGVATAEAGAV